MTEEEARAKAAEIAGPSLPMIERYAELLVAESARQNLIASSTRNEIWSRHLLDSLQLARFARDEDRTWIDVGSGAGLPGLVIGALNRWKVALIEPRRRRAEFLTSVIERLGMPRVVVQMCDVREIRERGDVISARAVTSLERLFDLTRGCADEATRYVLPKGRSARMDVDLAQQRWHGLFHVEQSITDADAGIVIADRVSPN